MKMKFFQTEQALEDSESPENSGRGAHLSWWQDHKGILEVRGVVSTLGARDGPDIFLRFTLHLSMENKKQQGKLGGHHNSASLNQACSRGSGGLDFALCWREADSIH